MRTVAPAKINWTLEVLGRRADGYHEIRSVMQTIDLADTLSVEAAPALTLEVDGAHAAREDDLVLRAARALARHAGVELGARIHVAKRIPVAAGLGGGSSDAAAALRCLDRLWGLRMAGGELMRIAGEVSSDAPFFVAGGAALAKGRGERIETLPDSAATWIVLLAPDVALPDKTRRMYEALSPGDFTDGSRTAALAEHLAAAAPVTDDGICNAFERVAYEVFEGLRAHRQALAEAGAQAVHLAGSGPALFCLAHSEDEARHVLSRLRAPGCRTFVARTLPTREAAAVED